MLVIADSGPLIALAKINRLELLRQLYENVLTGPTTYTEVVTVGLAQKAVDAEVLNTAYTSGWLHVRTPSPAALPVLSRLHQGEAESIRLAIELKADWLLLDDLFARRAAQLNFQTARASTGIKGTLGVTVTACQENILSRPDAIEMVNALKIRPDVWLSAQLCDAVIRALQAS